MKKSNIVKNKQDNTEAWTPVGTHFIVHLLNPAAIKKYIQHKCNDTAVKIHLR